jgi:hypothetical protein
MSGVHNEIVTKTSKQSQANLAGDRTDLKHFGGGARARPFPGDTGLLLGGELEMFIFSNGQSIPCMIKCTLKTIVYENKNQNKVTGVLEVEEENVSDLGFHASF